MQGIAEQRTMTPAESVATRAPLTFWGSPKYKRAVRALYRTRAKKTTKRTETFIAPDGSEFTMAVDGCGFPLNRAVAYRGKAPA